MTPLERRDRRRAVKLVQTIAPMLGFPAVVAVAAALKREREEATRTDSSCRCPLCGAVKKRRKS